jgi:broad specificity phosphatase PhoE
MPELDDQPIRKTVRLRLICHASTLAVRTSAFPDDEPLDEKGATAAAALFGRIARADRVLVSPTRRARRTALALGLDAADAESLRDCDYGRWRGRALADVAAAEPEAIATWLADPAAAPHGGESIVALVRRVGAWLDSEGLDRSIVAITHAAVIRAAVISALGAPAAAFWRIDAAPLSITELRRNDRRWALRAIPL